MYSLKRAPRTAGFTFVEVIVVSAVSVMVFGALFLTFKYALNVTAVSKARLSALSVATDRLEYFRSLPYDDVGTILGIPAGTVPQNSTTTLNGIEFAERVLVEYVDDDADGQGGADSNAILADYKRVKLEYTWEVGGESYSTVLVSNIVPRSVETTAGGGTVRINVLDDQSVLLPNASVRLFNSSTTPAIDVTRSTDASGAALFSGTPASSSYQVQVTGPIAGHDYSIDQTYVATVAVPNPVVAPFTVVEADVSTLTFQIGELSDLDFYAMSAMTEDFLFEPFDDLLSVASSSNASTTAGALVLSDVAGVYTDTGTVYLGPIAPASLERWRVARLAVDVPTNTSYKVQFFTGSAPNAFVLVPDSDLLGNAAGFSDTFIDISALDVATYPSLFMAITLDTTDTSETPEVSMASLYYRESSTPLTSTAFTMHGNKLLGTDALLLPIYKYDASLTTDGAGQVSLNDMEFDNYSVSFAGRDLATACDSYPFVQQAGVDGYFEALLVAGSAHTVRVTVRDTLGRVIPGATVKLSRPGYNTTIVTNSCGQSFFSGGGLVPETDYVIDVSAAGFTAASVSSFGVDGDVSTVVILSE